MRCGSCLPQCQIGKDHCKSAWIERESYQRSALVSTGWTGRRIHQCVIGPQKVSKLFKVTTVDFGQHAGKLIAGRRDASVGHKEPDPIGRFGRDRGESILAKLTFAGG